MKSIIFKGERIIVTTFPNSNLGYNADCIVTESEARHAHDMRERLLAIVKEGEINPDMRISDYMASLCGEIITCTLKEIENEETK